MATLRKRYIRVQTSAIIPGGENPTATAGPRAGATTSPDRESRIDRIPIGEPRSADAVSALASGFVLR